MHHSLLVSRVRLSLVNFMMYCVHWIHHAWRITSFSKLCQSSVGAVKGRLSDDAVLFVVEFCIKFCFAFSNSQFCLLLGRFLFQL